MAGRVQYVKQPWFLRGDDPLGLGAYQLETGWLPLTPLAAPVAVIGWMGAPTDRCRLDLTALEGGGAFPSIGLQLFATQGCLPGQLVGFGNFTPTAWDDSALGHLCTIRGWPCTTWEVRMRIITPGAAPLKFALTALVDRVGGDPVFSQGPNDGLLQKGAP